jgi:hypothetical protein
MKWIAAVFTLVIVSGCMAQQMDERNDPALQLTFYTPHRISISKERQANDLLRTVWAVVPYIAETYDHSNKWFGIVVELHGNREVLNTGAGGLMFTVDGKQVGVAPAILAHSHREPSCVKRCTVTWNISPKSRSEESALVEFVQAVANGHEVYATLFPPHTGSGHRFTAKLTDEQLLGFHEARQYYDSLTLVKKAATQ